MISLFSVVAFLLLLVVVMYVLVAGVLRVWK